MKIDASACVDQYVRDAQPFVQWIEGSSSYRYGKNAWLPDPNSVDEIYGTSGDDLLVGDRTFSETSDNPPRLTIVKVTRNRIFGYAGNDTLYGLEGLDELSGGEGDDLLYGGSGNDTLYGDNGNDVLYGGSGNDTLYGGSGNNVLYGDEDNDTLYVGLGVEELHGGGGDDLFQISGDHGSGSIDGGEGYDTVLVYGDVKGYTFTNVEELRLYYGGIYITAAQANSFPLIKAASGSDKPNVYLTDNGTADFSTNTPGGVNVTAFSQGGVIAGSAGFDTFNVNIGVVELHGGGGDDLFQISGDHGSGSIDGGEGYDTVLVYGDVKGYTFTNVEELRLYYGGIYITAAQANSFPLIKAASGSGKPNVYLTDNGTADFSTNTPGGVNVTAFSQGGVIAGSAGFDTFNVNIGVVELHGGGGDDLFQISGDHGSGSIDGGEGYDTVLVYGDVKGYTFTNVEELRLYYGGIYITAAQANSFPLIKAASGSGKPNVYLTDNGTADFSTNTPGGVNVTAFSQGGVITGSAGFDTFNVNIGVVELHGGGGDDLFQINGDHGSGSIDGGEGYDTVLVYGDVKGYTFTNVEELRLYYGGIYITAAQASSFPLITVASGSEKPTLYLTDNGTADFSTSLSQGVNFFASSQGNIVIGDMAADKFTGGAAADTFTGGGGNDVIDGGGGADTAVYVSAAKNYTASINASGKTIVADQRAGSPDGTDTLTSIEMLQFADASVAVSGNVLTQYNVDGTALVSTFNIAGQSYGATVYGYGTDGYNLYQRFNGVSGASYSSYEYDFSHGNFIGQKFFYTNVSGQAYNAYEADYTSGGTIQRLAFSGVTGQAYSSYEYDYVGGLYAGAQFNFTNVSGQPYSAYEYDYDAAGFAGSRFFYTNVQNQSYTGYEADYDKTGAVARVLLTGVTSQSYSAYEYDYANGAVSGSKFYTTNVTGQNYTGYEQDYDAAGHRTKLLLTGMTGTGYSAHEYDYAASGAQTGEKYFFTNVTGQNYYAYEVDQNASGATTKVIKSNNDSSHSQDGYANSQVFTALGNDAFFGGGLNETFVFQNVFGQASINDFYAHLSGTGHDTIQFATSQFADFAGLLSHTADSAGGAVITDAFGDTLTLANVTKAQIAANAQDFSFV